MGQWLPIVHGYHNPHTSKVAARLDHGMGELLDTMRQTFVEAFDAVPSDLADEVSWNGVPGQPT